MMTKKPYLTLVFPEIHTNSLIRETLTISPYLSRPLRSIQQAQADILRDRIAKQRAHDGKNTISFTTLNSAELKAEIERRNPWRLVS